MSLQFRRAAQLTKLAKRESLDRIQEIHRSSEVAFIEIFFEHLIRIAEVEMGERRS